MRRLSEQSIDVDDSYHSRIVDQDIQLVSRAAIDPDDLDRGEGSPPAGPGMALRTSRSLTFLPHRA